MTIETFQEEVRAYAKFIGIDKIGFASAAPFVELKARLIRQQELSYQSGFEEPDLEKRTTPKLLQPDAQSIISIALAYPSRMKDAPQGKKGARRGIFARASWGDDYHHVLREKLAMLEMFIVEHYPGAVLTSMVDTGELSDRAVAERAGIGWSAKNTSIITPEFGSYVYLGEMITNISFRPDTPIEDQCGDCTLCLDVCPTGAIVEGGQLNAQRCIAFLTQTKSYLPDEFRVKIGNRIYGCDTCQTVCPKNKGVDFHLHPEFEPDPEKVKPLLQPLLKINNRAFKEQFGQMSGSWRGKKPIQRNAILAIAHFKEIEAVDDLIEIMQNDPREVIRGTAAWAIGKIGTDAGRVALEEAMKKEQDPTVIEEIRKGLGVQLMK
ncbi:tRNA epoxyqueuosine(34) reductase QueG [Paenisporosarcina cavernae]|uniref:tRNA epoxyqueuosine(34) reductase QueG n=1 Tax=Paenisporosarcina cavernae TaxID=2320858 RepID=A0A385YUR2_9BACL|nr:tRNA epoxyqueuosine(34) reductase QueG [Paenisporosarcina cavernae]AYC30211.1 tRNA epoxyqueuosine(34) reductase QueG [Paenisporosarcina cavernae]